MGRGWKNFLKHDQKSLECFEQTVGKIIDVKDYSKDSKEVGSTMEKTYTILDTL